MNLRTAESEPLYQGSRTGAEAVLNVLTRRGEVPPHLPSGRTVSAEVEVVANHGRWLVECPFCPSAQVASVSDRRFFCVDCGNAEVGGAFVKTVWPDDLADLDAALGQRPPANANWQPHEKLGDIRRESAANGVGA